MAARGGVSEIEHSKENYIGIWTGVHWQSEKDEVGIFTVE